MFAFLAPAALKLIAGKAVSNAKRDWDAIPPKLKLALLGLIAAVALFFAHQHYAHKALKAADAVGYARAMNEVAAKAVAIKAKADAVSAQIATYERNRNDEENRRIVTVADDQRLHGPGKAVCRSGSVIPAAASGAGPSNSGPDAAGPQVPAGDWAAVPWLWLVNRAEQSDLDRAEVLSWRDWYAKQSAAWPKSAPTQAGGK